MELRHLRYFIAVAEEGSLTVAAQKRLHTAQPSLSRQIHDLELELGVQLLIRGPRGIELTPSGRVFLDHARVALLQVEAAGEAARRAAQPAKSSFTIGFLTGYEMDWLPAVMGILRTKLRHDPVLAFMPRNHPLAARSAIRPQDLADQAYIGVSPVRAPTLRVAIEDFFKRNGLPIKPVHQAENLAMAISLIASTGGISLLPLYAQNLLPKTIVSRPIQGAAPMVDLVIGYNAANSSPLLKFLLSKLEEIKFQVSSRDGR
jgi:LysR family transcriptional regulator, hca operon transcriptional activator